MPKEQPQGISIPEEMFFERIGRLIMLNEVLQKKIIELEQQIEAFKKKMN